MRIVAYGPASLGGLGFLAEGLECLGHSIEWRTDRGAYRRGCEDVHDFDLALTDGVRGSMREMCEDAAQAGVPVFVTDLGYIRRDLGYFQVGIGRLNWLPAVNCPPDRWKALDVSLSKRAPGEYVLITGQKPGDGSHHMDANQLTALYQGWVEEISKYTDRPIWFRPHPSGRDIRLSGVEHDIPAIGPSNGLKQAIAGAHAVVTYTSTSGTDALLAGKPVFCDPGAQCAPIANTDFSQIENPFMPTIPQRRKHFSKVAYAQWTHGELQDGTAARFLLDLIG